MDIWVLNPSDTLPGEAGSVSRSASLAAMLSEHGHRVVWWTASFSHEHKRDRDPQLARSPSLEGVDVRMLHVPPYERNASAGRLYNHWVFARAFARKAVEAVSGNALRAPQVIIASSPPLDTARAGIRVAKRFRAKCIVDLRDLWPEAFRLVLPRSMRSLGRAIFVPWKMMAVDNLRNCDAVVAVSKDYLRRAVAIAGAVKPSALVHLGVDLGRFDDLARQADFPALKGPHEFWVVFVGGVSRSYALETVIRAAEVSKREGDLGIKFMIVGDGPERHSLEQLSNRLGLDNVVFTGFLGPERMIPILMASDVAVNAVDDGTFSAFPNKVFDYFAAGLPVLNSIYGGELEETLTAERAGLQYRSQSGASLFEALSLLHQDEELRLAMGLNARRLAESRYDRRVAYSRFVDLIHDLEGDDG